MIDPETYIGRGIPVLKKLYRQGDLKSSYRGCQELLKFDPYNKYLLKLFAKIEKKILRQNKKKVKHDIRASQKLWKEGRFEELLSIYQKLYLYAPQYRKLEHLIRKAEERLASQTQGKRHEFIKNAEQVIQKIYGEKRLGETIQTAQELLTVDPLNAAVQSILQKARDEFIDQKLKENERIVDSGDFERALELYESLLSIDSKSSRLLALVKEARQALAERDALERKIRVNEGLERIKDHFGKQEYEKVTQACLEVLQLSPANVFAKLYWKKAEAAIEEEIETQSLKKMKENLAKLIQEYTTNKTDFVKV